MTTPPIDEMPYRKGANAIIINSVGEILIVQKISYADDQWNLPGGGLEDRENPEEGIKRELLEELGTSKFEIVSISQHMNKFEWPADVIERGFNKRNKWYRGQEKFQFLVKFIGDKSEIRLQESEIKLAKWVWPKDLKEYLVFPNQFDTVSKVLEEFKIQ